MKRPRDTPPRLPTPITKTRKQGDKLPGSSWVFSWYLRCFFFLQLLSSTMHSAGQAAPEGIKGPAGSRYKSMAVPRAPPLPATSHPPLSLGDSQKGGVWSHNYSRCDLTLGLEVCSRTAQVCQPQVVRAGAEVQVASGPMTVGRSQATR